MQHHIDGALMEKFLGSIVTEETCQTVTYHSDTALMKIVPGDVIKVRQGPLIPPELVFRRYHLVSRRTKCTLESGL
jgi:hypothetical protein